MLEGKRFFPDTGIPIWKIERIRMLFDDWLPEPFAVATWIEKSFTMAGPVGGRDEAFSSRTTLTDLLLLAGSGSRFPRGSMITNGALPRGAPARTPPASPRMRAGGPSHDSPDSPESAPCPLCCGDRRNRLFSGRSARRPRVPVRRSGEDPARRLVFPLAGRSVDRLRRVDSPRRRKPVPLRRMDRFLRGPGGTPRGRAPGRANSAGAP